MKYIKTASQLDILLLDSIHFTSQYELVESVTENSNLKFVYFTNVNINYMTKEKINYRYPSKENLCFIRFNDNVYYDGMSKEQEKSSENNK